MGSIKILDFSSCQSTIQRVHDNPVCVFGFVFCFFLHILMMLFANPCVISHDLRMSVAHASCASTGRPIDGEAADS